jgi:hypothetical protein
MGLGVPSHQGDTFMENLTPEERRRIYEEESVKVGQGVSARKPGFLFPILGLAVLVLVLVCGGGLLAVKFRHSFGGLAGGSSDSLPRSLDQTNLASVLTYYYGLGQPFSAKGKWQLLSSTTAKETDRESWEHKVTEGAPRFSSLEVLGEEARGNSEYARVSAVQSIGDCREVSTHTWMKEGGLWRRLLLPRTAELTRSKLNDGDYAGAVRAAKDWLAIDPFSEEAYAYELLGLHRGGASPGDDPGRLRPDIVRALLSINPHSGVALSRAVSEAGDPEAGEILLDRMSADDCQRSAAVFDVALAIKDPQKRLDFLDTHGNQDAGSLCLRVWALSELKRYTEVASTMTSGTTDKIRRYLDAEDATFAADWATTVGYGLYKAHDLDGARSWANYGLGRDPTSTGVMELMKAINKAK